MTKQIQEQLINLIDNQSLEEFISLYSKHSSLLKSYQHTELLFRSCRLGLLSFVEYILNSKLIDINCSHPSTGYPLLFISIRSQKHDIIRYIIQQTNANINWSCQNNEITCLNEAIRQLDYSTVILLLEHGCTINQSHLFGTIIECFRQRDKNMHPLIILDELINRCPKLIHEIDREQLTQFILNRSHCLLSNSNSVVCSLLEKFSLNINYDLVNEISLMSMKQNKKVHRTQVGIIGCGPSGLLLGALLFRSGIDSIIIEEQSRSDVESNTRAGVLEQSTIDLLDEVDINERVLKEGIIQRCINIQFNGERISVPITEYTEGKVSTFYSQNLVVQDLIESRLKTNQRLWFDIEYARIERHNKTDDGQRPLIKFRRRNSNKEELIECDFIAGCDGGASKCCRHSIPKDEIRTIRKSYPYSWLSILVDSPPNGHEVVYSFDKTDGFALQSLRSPTKSRYHLQVSVDDKLEDWPDERIWSQLNKRLTLKDKSWKLNEGAIIHRALFPTRTSMTIPMQYKRLFLVGDAAHIVPPTAAKGLNVAVKDARILAEAIIDVYDNNTFDKLDNYTDKCLIHISEAVEFATYMTSLLHKLDLSNENNEINEFDEILQQARQHQFQHSSALRRHIAQMFVS
ncbi:unnamed protein product [Adineta steineri]|uniref:FAD-binding domain-containing protein n=2 Tax=Adineta steineri TaxID=433720 RepID=A0A814JZR3_9BILA|nr:unnamed protein product [Adineta steineri]